MATAPDQLEEQFLLALRPKYEGDGYRFVVHPSANDTPEFLREFRPDALALSEKGNLVIEVKRRRAPEHQRRLSEMARAVQRHSGWKMRVYYSSPTNPQLYSKPSTEDLKRQFEEAKKLFQTGQLRASFILGWATLEATARALSHDEEKTKAMMPRELISWLAQEGYIDPQARHELRELVPVRNAIVHGSTETPIRTQHWLILERLIGQLLQQVDDPSQ